MMIDFSDFITERTEVFTGREWVFNAIDEWLGDPAGKRTFLLVGGPGTGKSAILARLAQFSLGQASTSSSPRLVSNFLAYNHFCQAQYDRTLNPLRFVEALSQALSMRTPGYAETLIELARGDQNITINATQSVGTAGDSTRVQNVVIRNLNVGNVSARVAFDRIVRQPLEILSEQGHLEPLVILVDSLDESRTWREQDNILTLLAETLDDPRDLPAMTRLILSSREDDRVLSALGVQPSLNLIVDAPPDLKEVRRYASKRLASAGLDREVLEKLASRVSEAAAGNFLYTRYVLDDWLGRPLELIQELTLELPSELSGIYRQFLQRELARDQEKWEDRYQIVLGLLAVANGKGLTTEQLAGASGQERRQIHNALRACDQYLAGLRPTGPFRLYHQSFRDFLLSDDRYRVYPEEANRNIAQHFLGEYAGNWLEDCDSYALQYTAAHLFEAATTANRQRRLTLVASLIDMVTDLGYCEAKTRHFGIFTILDDYRLAQQFEIVDDERRKILAGVLKTFQRETHVLSKWDADESQVFFAQQVFNRAKSLGLELITNAADRRLKASGQPYLALSWLATRQSPELMNVLVGHEDFIYHVALTNDDRFAATADGFHGIKLWDLNSGQEIWAITTQNWEDCNCIAITAEDRFLIMGGFDGLLRTYNLTTRTSAWEIQVGSDEITALAATDAAVYVVSREDGLTAWEVKTGQRAALPIQAEILETILMITKDGRYGLARPQADLYSIWELASGRRVCQLTLPEDPQVLAVSPDAQKAVLATGASEDYEETYLHIFNLLTGEMVRTIPIRSEGFVIAEEMYVSAILIHPGRDEIITATALPSILIYDLNSGEFIRSLAGHEPSLEGGVSDLALTSDGRRLISAGMDKTVRIWDLESEFLNRPQSGHDKRIIELSVSEDGTQAVSASEDLTFKFWEIGSGSEVRSLTCHLDEETLVDAIAVQADHSTAISYGNMSLEWDLSTGEVIGEFPYPITEGRSYTEYATGYLGAKTWVALDRSGKYLLECFYPDRRTRIEIWDINSGKHQGVFRGPNVDRIGAPKDVGGEPLVAFITGGQYGVFAEGTHVLIADLGEGRDAGELGEAEVVISSITATPDGRIVLAGTEDGRLIGWKFSSRKMILSSPIATEALHDLAVTPDGRNVIARTLDGALRSWDISTGGSKLVLEPAEVLYLVETGSQKRSACHRSSEDRLTLYDLQTGESIGEIPFEPLTTVRAVSNDRRFVLTSNLDSGFQLWRLPDGRLMEFPFPAQTTAAAFSADSHRLLCGLDDGWLESRDLSDGKTAWRVELHAVKVIALEVAADGSLGLSASEDGTIVGWDPLTGEGIFGLSGPNDPPWVLPSRLEVLGDGRVVVSYPTAPAGGFAINGWDLDAGESMFVLEERGLEEYQQPPLRAIFSSDGESILYPTGSGDLKIFNYKSGQEGARLKLGKKRQVLSLCGSQDDKTIVAGMADGSLRLWRGKQTRNPGKHAGAVLAVAITPDHRFIISGSSDRTIKLWDLLTRKQVISVSVDGAVERVAAAPDSKTVLAGDRNGNVYCYRLIAAGHR